MLLLLLLLLLPLLHSFGSADAGSFVGVSYGFMVRCKSGLNSNGVYLFIYYDGMVPGTIIGGASSSSVLCCLQCFPRTFALCVHVSTTASSVALNII